MPKSKPQRTCIVTGLEFPREHLLRFVISPENRVVPDIKGTLPGKGIWMQPKGTLLRDACRKNLFSKAARRKVTADAQLPEQVEKLLRERALAYLSRARLAGDLASGHEKVRALLQSGEAAVLIHAEDAAQDGNRKLDKYAEGAVVLHFGDRDTLGEALNLPNPVHLAIKKGGIADAFLHSYDSWAGFQREDTL